MSLFGAGVKETVDVGAQRHDAWHLRDDLARAMHVNLFVEEAQQRDGKQRAVVVQFCGAQLERAAVGAKGGEKHWSRHVVVVRRAAHGPRHVLSSVPEADGG